jgi:thioesterase domain-containing protein
MASSYVEVIRLAQPEGPYLIGGWSMGAIVSFEIARQLHFGGERVALLALLDVWTPSFYQQPQEDEATLVATFDHHLAAAMGEIAAGAEGNRAISEAERERLFQIYKGNLLAMRRYVPGFYDGRITLLRTERNEDAESDATMGWSDFAGEGVEVHLVPGNHFTMINEPHVQVLAERLRAAIERAEEQAQGFPLSSTQETHPKG